MKRFWISVSIFIILIALSIFSLMYIKTHNSKMMELLTQVTADYSTGDTATLQKLHGYWKNVSNKYSIFVSHDKLTKIDILIDELFAIWPFKNSYTAMMIISDIRTNLEAIEIGYVPSIYNIL